MSAHSDTLDQVLRWIHNDKAAPVREDFWKNAADRIAGDLFNVDTTNATWDEESAAAFPSLWFFACLREGRIWAEDDVGMNTAEAGYQTALALANSRQRQGAAEQSSKPYEG